MNTYRATYRGRARRTVRAEDYFDARKKLTLVSGTQPESVTLVTDDGRDREKVKRAYEALQPAMPPGTTRG